MNPFLRRAAWVVPAWCVAASALILHAPLWKRSVGMHRSGFMAIVPAHVLIVSVPTFTVLYALTFTWFVHSMTTGGRGLRTPTEAELGCAAWLLRAMIIVVLYAFAFLAWRV